MEWFKFFGGEFLSDPKMLSLTAEERSCWLTLLCYASISEIPGEIKYLDEYKLMIVSGISTMDENWDTTKGILKKFENLRMITLCNEIITVVNFRKRQNTALSNYERVKKFRQKNQMKHNDNENYDKISMNDNAMITDETKMKQNDNTRREENRRDSMVAATPPNNHFQEIIDFYYDAYKTQEGVNYTVSGADGKAVKTALTQMTPQEIKCLLRWYLQRPDFKKFPCIKSALSNHFINLYRLEENNE